MNYQIDYIDLNGDDSTCYLADVENLGDRIKELEKDEDVYRIDIITRIDEEDFKHIREKMNNFYIE